jgi:hypothetical protein
MPSPTPKTKKLLALGDLHTGSWCGLTPPHHDSKGASKASIQRYEFRRELWDWYKKTLDLVGKVDACLVNGDLIDGGGRRSGGSEVIVASQDQPSAAAYSCGLIQTKSYYLTYGTGYHTGEEFDHELAIAQQLGGSIADRQFLRINNKTIRSVHHAGGSGIPHGVHTYPARVAVGQKLKAMDGEEPEADILLFSHRHIFSYEGDATRFSMRLPCLQGPMSKFGRRCEGGYTMGMVLFTFNPDGTFQWKLFQAKLQAHIPLLSHI